VRHLATLDQLSRAEMGILLATVEQSIAILKKVMRPEGFNVGLNLGKVAGAGWKSIFIFISFRDGPVTPTLWRFSPMSG